MKTPGKPLSAIASLAGKIAAADKPLVDVPDVGSFLEFLEKYARVRLADGSYAPYRFEGREPLRFVAELISKILLNCLHGQTVEIDGVTYKPGKLKGATVSVCGGAQFGKSVLELNLMAYVTSVEFINAGYYTPDTDLLQKIVDTKFRPDVIDQVPWMPSMIYMGKAESASGKSVNRKNSFQVTNGLRKAFGHFCHMQKPPTTISLDLAIPDEVDDIPDRNIGFIAGRMTNSPLRLTCFIGTQRKYAAGQHKRFTAGTEHVYQVPCTSCGKSWELEDTYPSWIRIALDGTPRIGDPKITEEQNFDPDAHYYCACPDCGAAMDRNAGAFKARRPERAKQLNFSIRISQFAIAAIGLDELVAAWYAAMQDPSGEAMIAFNCDRAAVPKSGALQPITPQILIRSRSCGIPDLGLNPRGIGTPYPMALSKGTYPGQVARVAGLDTGPRCWFVADEIQSPLVSPLVWAEMMASGNALARVPLLMDLLGIGCVFIDGGGEPELTKQLCLTLNGLEGYVPPVKNLADLRTMTLANISATGASWDPASKSWRGIRAASVMFSLREARGVEQDIGMTVDGKIYPLIKCNRAEAIQTAVNDFLTPAEGMIEQVETDEPAGRLRRVRSLPRQRLPMSAIGPGVTSETLDAHLMNLRKERDPATGQEDWADGIENHLGLAKTYARLCAMFSRTAQARPFAYESVEARPGYADLCMHKGALL